ncbi:MAG: S1C family peptidase [Candidatus Woesebacteria bacterium GW2011_GWA1_33_30]|uniref:S1C family peptidase n=1 Tax=Candidatus Woesebacteria bacterium GW2011_GWA2_33_28 TaxID=1618561 RepID=A0A0G0CSE0_9BACT|nr:MAG: S1C family peptidase [Candidatus Woesebacteria bacterium GW2011_GWA2_33_28]KKP46820.1 MAG: S1C family peptidase [Candidatus Woesebacteria bacterium GW2011_GWA1_33_30]KKP48464.1 MAG: S1C family peptidase [Microgenomates group bacterium GW2011_GWC1_33_32]KKP51311.1 MAG: S1C family peptidase [Candidatus Woesebacteria bacterium GW2011_GWB1_33_38]KKP56696.1 MAG: S1C family peptidase [Microgenomates group bacterium GW2011_GWD1_33_9]
MKKNIKEILYKFKLYIKRLLFPLWLFPIKLVTYSTYYFLKLVWKIVSWPFRKWSNLGKTILWLFILTYFIFSLLVIFDYLSREYGNFDKIFCGAGVKDKLRSSVVRIIGGYGEGSGFFISPTEVVTNFHVISDEPSPKVVFPDGHFETPEKIVGEKNMDIAVLTLKNSYPDMVYELPTGFSLVSNEPLLSAGYPLGSDVTGDVTIVKGNFIDFRRSRKDVIGYLQTNISLVKGMSGGPLVDQCGAIVGINTQSLAGISFFITASDVKENLVNLTDQEISKIEVDPSKSPEEAVYAFYTYLKARQMEKGYNLLSSKYLEKTNSTEWTNRFTDILDVDVISTEKYEDSIDTVFVKFGTTNWVDGEAEYHYYEGTWETVVEEGIYKMNKSKIIEIEDPDYGWFYE